MRGFSSRMGSCCPWDCHDLHPQHPDLFCAARTRGLRERLPSAGTIPRDPNHCRRPRNSTSALKFTEHSLQRLGGIGNDSEGSASGRWSQWTSAKGPETTGACYEKAATTSRCPGCSQPGTAAAAGTDPCDPHRSPSTPHPHPPALPSP